MMATQRAHSRAPKLTTLAACVALAFATGSVCADAPTTANLPAGAHGNRALFGARAPSTPNTAGNLRRASAKSAAPLRPAGLVEVTNCDDNGPGSLREAATNAVSGDVLDLHRLTCSTISLTSGAIEMAADVFLLGPGQDALTIDGNQAGYVLYSGFDLSVLDLTIANGSSTSGYGGCISTVADLSLTRSTVTHCQAGDGSNNGAFGGGADVRGNLTMVSSTISDSHALGVVNSLGGGAYVSGTAYLTNSTVSGSSSFGGSDQSRGGGLFVKGAVQLQGSLILGNSVTSADGTAYGGGIASEQDGVEVVGSTISGNTAHSSTSWSYGGGIVSGEFGAVASDITLHNSTVSGNIVTADCDSCYIDGGGAHAFGAIRAYYSAITDNHVISAATSNGIAQGGGLATFAAGTDGFNGLIASTMSGNSAIGGQGGFGKGGGMVTVYDSPLGLISSTVAFNRASTSGGGAVGGDAGGTYASTVVSSIVANNEAPAAADLASLGVAFTVAGNNSLVMSADSNLTLPLDTLSADPKLLPLASNGGATVTHALAACSPAINAGSNTFTGFIFQWDQRGDPFVREFGVAPDIGAFELQPNADVIFKDGFDGSPCP